MKSTFLGWDGRGRKGRREKVRIFCGMEGKEGMGMGRRRKRRSVEMEIEMEKGKAKYPIKYPMSGCRIEWRVYVRRKYDCSVTTVLIKRNVVWMVQADQVSLGTVASL